MALAGGVVIYAADLDDLSAFYGATLGFHERARDATHVVLEAHGFQLVLLRRNRSDESVAGAASNPAERRAAAAIKPVFMVASIALARAAAARAGGIVNAARHEWRFGAYRVCDGLDPEGNVIQLRERIDGAPSESRPRKDS